MYPAGIFYLWFGFVMVKFITCYSDGTLLADYCQGMNINHDGIAAQTTEAPFTVTPEQRTFTDLEVGHDIDVTLSGTAGNTFIGFMLEARKCETCPPAGTFSLTDLSKTVLLSCDGQNVSPDTF
ncbi:ferric-chelate reductase 1-like [Paramisgurnus dabryanus]|uniref:ferric-chelate reductase 1-like n=1 Tax=Paramisgurnus dabryanus TaxID=90735 RepID=UPI003CCF5644